MLAKLFHAEQFLLQGLLGSELAQKFAGWALWPEAVEKPLYGDCRGHSLK
ncbi:MAG: hypothetical protein WCK47_04205 [bacterium]|nr:hypothetical protein [Candidatus Sumerlaeota bacterium]